MLFVYFYGMAEIIFEQDTRTDSERFAERFETFYAYYLSMIEYWQSYVKNELDMPLSNRVIGLGKELKDLHHDIKNSK